MVTINRLQTFAEALFKMPYGQPFIATAELLILLHVCDFELLYAVSTASSIDSYVYYACN